MNKKEKTLFNLSVREQTISSLEIAQLAGKKHNHVMRDIRDMEPAWVKNNGTKFGLIYYTDSRGRQKPCYNLTLDQALYIVTKYNNEARARLVMRWMQLEEEKQMSLHHQLQAKDNDLVYMHKVLESHGTLTTTQIAKELGMSAIALNKFLHEQGVQFKQSDEWQLYAVYQDQHLMDKETLLSDGSWVALRRPKWTEDGHKFINQLVTDHRKHEAWLNRPRYIELPIVFID